MDTINEMLVFARVARKQNFSAAARELGVSTSAVSKAIRKLEARLGARLLNRSTRRVSLTEAGSAYFAHCETVVAEVEAAELTIAQMSAEPSGVLRVTAPVSFGLKYISEVVFSLLQTYPRLQAEVSFDVHTVDLLEGKFDVAIRNTNTPPLTFVARPIGCVRRLVCGSPAYFRKHGRPKTLEDLSFHRCSVFSLDKPRWCFRSPEGERVFIPIAGDFVSDNAEAIKRATLAGLGLAWLPTIFVEDELEVGQLESVLDDFSYTEHSLYALYPHRHHLSPKVRVFIDLLIQRFSKKLSRG